MPRSPADEDEQSPSLSSSSGSEDWQQSRSRWLVERGLPPDFFDQDQEEQDEDDGLPLHLMQRGVEQALDPSNSDLERKDALPYPEIVLGSSILILADPSRMGQLVEAVAIAWDRLLDAMTRDPEFLTKMHWRKLEELVAAAYHRQGWTVTLTPRSGDGGVDVIAERSDVGSFRVFDQVKKYAPNHVVTREEVDAMFGLICRKPNVSKGVITTTSTFAPGVFTEPTIVEHIPNRLELRDGKQLAQLLQKVRNA